MYSNPGTIYNNERPYTFTAHSLEEFNQEFEHIYVTALRDKDVAIVVNITEENRVSVFNFSVGSSNPDNGNISSMVTVTSSHLDDELYVNERSNPFDLIFSGLEGIRNISTRVTPHNCQLSGLKSTTNTFNSGQTYEFTAADSAALTSEFDDIMITPLQDYSVDLEISIDELTYILGFTNVKNRG